MSNKEISEAQNKEVVVSSYMAVPDSARVKQIKEKFKGFVKDREVKFPKKLGAEHPFDFKAAQDVLTHVGFISGAINKIKESIVGDFSIESDNENTQALLEDFVKNTNFTSVLREWIKEGLSKGNGFMEIDLKEQKVQVLNANNMYVKRNKHGEVKKYNQFIGKNFSSNIEKDEIADFKPNQIAHLKINKIANGAYGIGLLYPNERVIENLIIKEQDETKLISRKAGAPIHVSVGIEKERADPAAIDAFSNSLQFMTNNTEWVTDANVKMSVLDFGAIGENLDKSMAHDLEMLSAGMEIPMVLFGKANIPEGLAKVQLEADTRKIASIREEIESIIVNQIFKPLLASQSGKTEKVKGFEQQTSKGLAGDINFTWNLPGEEEKNARLEKLNNILQNFAIDEPMRRAIQLEMAKILSLEGLEEFLPAIKDSETDMEAEKKELEKQEKEEGAIRKKEENIRQPEVPGAKPTAKAKSEVKLKESNPKVCAKLNEHITMEEAGAMTLREYINITELAGFNYSDYLIKILQNLKIDKFTQLSAKSDLDLELGLLPERDISKLKTVLKDGFRKNKTIKQIEKEISNSIDMPDRFIEKDGSKVLSVSAKSRPNMIARTETVRLANAGLKDLYEENKIEKYQYLAAVDDRTSDICLSLNGNIFNVKDGQPGVNMPPMHANCRSTIVGIVE